LAWRKVDTPQGRPYRTNMPPCSRDYLRANAPDLDISQLDIQLTELALWIVKTSKVRDASLPTISRRLTRAVEDEVEDGDDEEFSDCVELLLAPDAETLAAIASLRAVVRPGEPGQCDVPALERARRELKAAIRCAAAEHEQKQENLLAQLKLRYAVAMAAAARVPLACAGATGLPTTTVGAAAATAGAAGAAELSLAAAGVAGQPLAAAGAAGLPMAAEGVPGHATVGTAEPSQATAGTAGQLPSPVASAKDRSATASPADDKPDAPDTGDTKPELLAPRKLMLKHLGWGSDDTKTFEKDRGGEHTHTHTHCSLFSKVASFLL
jgi:hypothetical protein